MEALFNCLFLNTDSLIPIPIYNNENGSSVEFVTVALLREFLSDKKDSKNTSDMILWRINVKKKDIKSVSTRIILYIVQKLHRKEINRLKGYFKDELDTKNFAVKHWKTLTSGRIMWIQQFRRAPQAKIELKPLVKTLNFINEKTPSIPSGMVAKRYLGLRGDLNIAMWITFIQSPS
ncbi:hypothetical protein RhiirA5_436219 [Rhizophagus irregularis]|uniref:Uncharacterized protein n=1 Tax=Rhizophagus irregularis TaxID=588596 RepID=A0A2N0NMA0_9GLOM|nr:hypothetical protein RhiirA5_436219 [Rhizophagus irregularis]